MTATQFIYQALRHIGRLRGPGQTASASENADGLSALNRMLESWSTERLNVFTITTATLAMVNGQNSYEIGPSGADFNRARPIRIESATSIVGGVSLPMTLINKRQWEAIVAKGATSPVMLDLYYDAAFPKAKFYVWPTPSGGPSLELGTWTPLSSFSDLVTSVTFPPGYELAIAFNLALQLAADYGVVPPADVVQIAAESKAAIRALNGAQPGAEPAAAVPNALPAAAPAQESNQ